MSYVPQRNKKALKKNEAVFREKYSVGALYILGSYATGLATKNSDIDILVEFQKTSIGIFEFLELKDVLQTMLGKKVDLVTRDAIKNWMRTEVERTAIRVA